MPFSDPIRDRRIQPQSLAFNDGNTARGNASVTYQSTVRETAVAQEQTDAATRRYVAGLIESAQANVMDAEDRAKQYVGEYSSSFEWDFSTDVTVTTNVYDPLGFNHEVIRCPGAYMVGTTSAADAEFEFHVGKGYQGVWCFYAHVEIVLTAGMTVLDARLGVSKNGTLWRVIDALDDEMSNDNALFVIDTVLGGMCQIPCAVGDVIRFPIYLRTGGASGDQLVGWPSSVVGHCGGFRLRCDDEIIDAAYDGTGFVFTG